MRALWLFLSTGCAAFTVNPLRLPSLDLAPSPCALSAVFPSAAFEKPLLPSLSGARATTVPAVESVTMSMPRYSEVAAELQAVAAEWGLKVTLATSGANLEIIAYGTKQRLELFMRRAMATIAAHAPVEVTIAMGAA